MSKYLGYKLLIQYRIQSISWVKYRVIEYFMALKNYFNLFLCLIKLNIFTINNNFSGLLYEICM